MHTNLDRTIVITDHDRQRLLPILEQNDTPASELLDSELHRALIVDQSKVSPDVVTMNSEVVYEDVATGARRTIRLVYPKDANASQGWVSVLAPIGSALLGLQVGQEIEWQLPTGLKRVVVIAVRYQPESRGEFHL